MKLVRKLALLCELALFCKLTLFGKSKWRHVAGMYPVILLPTHKSGSYNRHIANPVMDIWARPAAVKRHCFKTSLL